MNKREGYSPVKDSVQNRINAGWKAYRETFSLEGEEYFALLQSGANKETISRRMSEFKKTREELLVLWENEWLTQI